MAERSRLTDSPQTAASSPLLAAAAPLGGSSGGGLGSDHGISGPKPVRSEASTGMTPNRGGNGVAAAIVTNGAVVIGGGGGVAGADHHIRMPTLTPPNGPADRASRASSELLRDRGNGFKLDVSPAPLGNSSLVFAGRCLVAKDFSSALVVFFVIVLVAGFFGFVMSASSVAIWVGAIGELLGGASIFFLFITATKDPGIVRKRRPVDASSPLYKPPPPPGFSEFVMINGVQVLTPYCATCHYTRAPRVAHCNLCDNCVERFDHHCGVIGACIGAGNIRPFFAFLVSTSLGSAWCGAWSIVFLVHNWSDDSDWTRKGFAFAVSIVGTVVALQVGAMAIHYVRLFSTGFTQRENIKRDRLYGPGTKNPFDEGCGNNWRTVWA